MSRFLNMFSPPDPVARVSAFLVFASVLYSAIAYYLDAQYHVGVGIAVFVPSALVLAGQTQKLLGDLIRQVRATENKLSNKISVMENEVLGKVSNLENLYQTWRTSQRAVVVDDVKNDHQWRHIEGEFIFYNALWTLPADRFRDTFKYLLTDKGVHWRAVFFAGRTAKEKEISSKRQGRMWRAINEIVAENPRVASLIEVKRAREAALPGLTFFLFHHGNRKVVRLYVEKLVISDVPEIAFDIYDDTVFQLLKREFESHFHEGEKIDVPFDG